MRRLLTKEDRIGPIKHLHKTLGVLCLSHYIFRFLLCFYYQTQKDEDPWLSALNESTFSLFCILFHAALSFSSLIFKHIPRKQTTTKPMIWREFRMHNIAFATRSVLCCTIQWASHHNQMIADGKFILKGIIILFTFKSADIITQKLRVKDDESTTRTLAYWKGCPVILMKTFKLYYMFAQYQATITCFGGGIIGPFSVMFPIQIASFLMTCARKNLITTRTYHLLYIGSLFLPAIMFMKHEKTMAVHIPAFILTFLRAKYRINKYLLWAAFFGCCILHKMFSIYSHSALTEYL